MPGCHNRAEHIHHVVPNTKVNRKLYPLYIDSPFNQYPLCSICHEKKPLPPKPTERLLIVYEAYLLRLQDNA
jgi:hypothetical protein